MKRICLIFVSVLMTIAGVVGADTSADGAWSNLNVLPRNAGAATWVSPDKYSAFTISANEVQSKVFGAPASGTVTTKGGGTVLTLPKPDGTFERFSIVDIQTMEPK